MVAAVAVAMLVAACGSQTASPSPTAASATATSAPASIEASPSAAVPSAAASPSIAPSPTASPPLAGSGDYPELAWVNRFVMRVAVSDLNVRAKPSTSAASNGKAPKGGLFMIYDWPVVATGYTWYPGFTLLTAKPGVLPDLPTPIETGYDEVLGGWMAIGTEDTPFLVPLAPRCPATADLANVAGMLDSERISCFGAEAITFEGSGGAAPGTFEPAWLASPLEEGFLSASGGDSPTLGLRLAPGGLSAPAQGSRVRVRGHFSDERSSTCRIAELGAGEALVPIANAAAEQWCRSKFVVDNLEVIG